MSVSWDTGGTRFNGLSIFGTSDIVSTCLTTDSLFTVRIQSPLCLLFFTIRSESQRQFGARMKQIQRVWKAFLRDLKKETKQKGTPIC